MGDGLDSDTKDLLRGVRSDARESFYRPSGARTLVISVLIALSLVLVGIGMLAEKPLGYALMLGGIFGMTSAAVWFTYRP